MAKSKKHPYQALLEDTMAAWLWEDEVEYNEDGNFYHISTLYTVDKTSGYRMFLEAYVSSGLIKFYLYSPMLIPEKRYKDACVVLNRLNKNIYCGALDLSGESVRYIQTVDVEGFAPEVQLISNIRNAAGNAFRPKIVEALGVLAFTKLSVEDIIAQYEAPEENGDDDGDLPEEL
ncbi:MAG: YbjN domain-containing protein [Novosphingobium sp.]|jgi:hypothetical protein|uniref:YbjN domain-containing protein n=1 Tax=Novosphingobium sp. TaxID=1874826 RepID=UPI0030161E93